MRRRSLAGVAPPSLNWRGAGGVRIAGDSWGDPATPLVLLLHGAGQTRHAWRRTGRVLGAMGYHAVTLDARGHGDSDWAPDGDYSADTMIQDLVAVVEQLGRARAVLIGASMGGSTSLLATGEGHVDAAALVLVDIAARTNPAGTTRIKQFMNQRPDGFETLEEVADAIAAYQPHRPRPRRLDGLAKNVRIGEDGRYHWHWDPRFRSGRRHPAKREERRIAATRRLTVPTMLVRGGLSDVLTEEAAREFCELCPHAEHVTVAGAAHMVAGDRNDRFAEAVVEFLHRVVPEGGGP